ncbi:MAG: TA system VapC family ribonuclease toxin [Candidatus Dormibacteria bacterium]
MHAHRQDSAQHEACHAWLAARLDSDAAFGMADLCFSGFLRVVTHPGVFATPTPLAAALKFARTVRGQPNCVVVAPGARHWSIFTRLCEQAAARGNLVPNAFLAAMAIESGSRWVTTDRDYARFDGLSRVHPSEA